MSLLDKLKKFLHWEATPRPEVRISSELYSQLKPFRLPLILIILISMSGTMGYIVIDDMSLIDAIYQTGITFTTVGFGEIAPISETGRLFTITLIILGFGILTFSVGVLVEVISKGDLIDLFKERTMLYKIARLKNHFVICYHNEYTIELAESFREAHIPFVVIDGSPDFLQQAKKHKYPYFINEEPHTDLALRKAHLSSAKGAVLLSKSIADNIAQISTVRLYEKELGRKPYYLIVSAENKSDMEKLIKLGANNVVSPTKLMAQRISTMAIRPDMENLLDKFLYSKDTPLDMEEIKVPKNSWIVFKRLKEAHIRELTNVSVVGITEKDGKFIPMPDGNTQIMIDSKLIVIGTSDTIRDTKRLIRRTDTPEEAKFV